MAIWNVQHRVSVYQFIVFWAWEAFFQHGGRHARSNMRGHKNIKGSDRSEISVHYFLCDNTLRHIYLRNWALPLLENSVNIIAWLLSTPGVHTHAGTDSKTVKYRLRSLRTPQNFFDRMKNCIERVKLSSGLAVMVSVFSQGACLRRYICVWIRALEGACRRSALPCPLFIPVPHVP